MKFFNVILMMMILIFCSVVKARAEDKTILSGKTDELLVTAKSLVEALEAEEDVEAVQLGYELKSQYDGWKEELANATGGVYEEVTEALFKMLMKNSKDTSSLSSVIIDRTNNKNSSQGQTVENNKYEGKLVSCNAAVYQEKVYLALYLRMKSGYRIVRSLNGAMGQGLKIEDIGSENIKSVLSYEATSRPYEIGGETALAYDNSFYFPIEVEVLDKREDMFLNIRASFNLCEESTQSCSIESEDFYIYLQSGERKPESVYCQAIKNHYAARNDKQFSQIEIEDIFYGIYNGELALITTVKYPRYPYNNYMVIENDYGMNFDVSVLDKGWSRVTYIATSQELTKEWIKQPITIVIGERSASLIEEVTPRFNPQYHNDYQGGGLYFFKLIVIVLIAIVLITIYGWYNKKSYYNKKLLKTVSFLVGGFVGLLVLMYIFFSLVEKENYISIEAKEEIAEYLDSGQSVYLNVMDDYCLLCKYNDFLLSNMMYLRNKEEILLKNIDLDVHRELLQEYGITQAPAGLLITPRARYGIHFPNVVNEFDVVKLLKDILKDK